MRIGTPLSLTLLAACGLCAAAHASPLVTHTDGFGITWTLESDGVNHGTAANPVYDVFVFANTSGFYVSGSPGYNDTNSYINDISIGVNAAPTASSTTLGPDDMSSTTLWTNVQGGQNSNGCNSKGTNFDCAYYTTGGNPVTGDGVLMSSTETNLVEPLSAGAPGSTLEWEFQLGFAGGTQDPLSFATDGSDLKVNYFSDTKQGYKFIGMISDSVALNEVPQVPEPGTLALFGAGLLGCALFARRRARQG